MSNLSNVKSNNMAASIFCRLLGLCGVLFLAFETVDRIDQHNALNFATWVCLATGFFIAACWPLLKGTNGPVTGKLRIVAIGFLVMAAALLFLRMALK